MYISNMGHLKEHNVNVQDLGITILYDYNDSANIYLQKVIAVKMEWKDSSRFTKKVDFLKNSLHF